MAPGAYTLGRSAGVVQKKTWRGEPTLGEEAGVSVGDMLAVVPPVSELIVALEQLYAVAFD